MTFCSSVQRFLSYSIISSLSQCILLLESVYYFKAQADAYPGRKKKNQQDALGRVMKVGKEEWRFIISVLLKPSLLVAQELTLLWTPQWWQCKRATRDKSIMNKQLCSSSPMHMRACLPAFPAAQCAERSSSLPTQPSCLLCLAEDAEQPHRTVVWTSITSPVRPALELLWDIGDF